MMSVSCVAVSLAQVRARVAADAEERAAQRAVAAAVDAALRRVRIKLRHLELLDDTLAQEKGTLEV